MQSLKVKLTLLEPQLGTIPKDQKVFSDHVFEKKNELLEKHGEEVTTVPLDDALDDLEKRGYTGFHQDKDGLFVYDYMIRGFLKEAGNTLKTALNLKNVKSKIDNFVFVFPRRIHFKAPKGCFIIKPHGVIERPLRAMTAMGPRVTLAKSDYVVDGCFLEAEIKIIDNTEITPKKIVTILEYGELKGLGQFRNGSYGRFKTEVIE